MEKTSEKKSESYLVQRVIIAIQTGDAAFISSAMPPGSTDGDLQAVLFMMCLFGYYTTFIFYIYFSF